MKQDADLEKLPTTPPPIFYHSAALGWMISAYRPEIGRRLTEPALVLRERHLAPFLKGRGTLSGEEPWMALNTYLGTVETALAEIVKRHSPAFWFHLYRRISPQLSEIHDAKRDANTVQLVRQHAELAFAKHGDLTRTDLGPLHSVPIEKLLGGFFLKGVTDFFKSEKMAQDIYDAMSPSDVVMIEFELLDILHAFEIEGLAYEYWRICAMMRSVGKPRSSC